MKVNIIGAGSLGKSLAFALYSHGEQLTALCNRSLHSAKKASTAIGAGLAVEHIADLPAASLTFITTPDDAIAAVVSSLLKDKVIGAGSVVVHCSGALSSATLKPLKDSGCFIASIHPLKAFRASQLQKEAFQGCDCVVEGDEPAVALLTSLFVSMGAQVLVIDPAKKSIYHAAAVMASNYLVTLAGCAVQLLQEAGLPAAKALSMTQQLMQSSLTNIQESEHLAHALTGPLRRGDINTIAMHLQAIADPTIHALYRAAALATVPLTEHDAKTITALKALLIPNC